MSDNLKNDVKNAVPERKAGSENKGPVFKEPKFIMHCLINNIDRGTANEKELDNNEK